MNRQEYNLLKNKESFMKKIFVVLVLLALALISCTDSTGGEENNDGVVSGSEEYVATADDNDDFSTATNLVLNDTVLSTIYPNEDIDYYKIVLTEGGLYSVSCSEIPSSISVYLELYDDEENSLEFTYGEKGEDVQLYKNLRPGTYYIKISNDYNAQSATPFNVVMEKHSTELDEYNNDTANAQLITLGRSYSTNIIPATDLDYFKIILTEGGLYSIKGSDVPDSLRVSLSFLDDKDSTLAATYADAMGKDVELYANLKAGTYFVLIQESSRMHSSLEPFNFIVEKDEVDTLEFNNDIESAKTVYLNTLYSSKMFPHSDTDFHKITLEQAGLYSVKCDSVPSGLSLWVGICDDEGRSVAATSEISGSTVVLNRNIKAGTYFLRFHASGSSIKPFNWIFERDTIDTLEYNDDIESAKTITIGETYSSKMMPENDNDYHKVIITEGGIYTLSCDSVDDSIAIWLWLYDTEGNDISYSSNGAGKSAELSDTLDAGTYYFKMNSFRPSNIPFNWIFEKGTD